MKPHPTKSKPRIAKPSPRQPGKGARAYGVYINGNLEQLQMRPMPGDEWPLTPVLVLDLSPEARERTMNAFQWAFNRAPVGKEIEYGFAAIGFAPAGEGRGK